jgi:hypothetical protein
MGKAASGIVKWLLIPMAVAYVGYAFIGPNAGGQLKKAAGKLNLNPNLNAIPGATRSLTPDIKVRPIDSDEDEPAGGSGRKAESDGPDVEVSVRENIVIASNRSRATSGSMVAPVKAEEEKPKPRRRRRKPKPKPKLADTSRADNGPVESNPPPAAPTSIPDDGGSGGSVGGPEPTNG